MPQLRMVKISFFFTVKDECISIDSEPVQQQSPIMPTRVIAQPVVRQTVTAQPTTTYTESQINDFVSKCRTFLTTLLRLAEKQAPEKLPMVRSCIQELLVFLFKRNNYESILSYRMVQSIPNPSLNDFTHCTNLNHIYPWFHFSK